MLMIQKDDFNQILMELMQDELDIKIKLISTFSIFENFEPFTLIPIANLLKIEKYGINDVIIYQGEEYEKFYIVAQGRLEIIRIHETSRSKQISPYCLKLLKKPQRIRYGKIDYVEMCRMKENPYQLNNFLK